MAMALQPHVLRAFVPSPYAQMSPVGNAELASLGIGALSPYTEPRLNVMLRLVVAIHEPLPAYLGRSAFHRCARSR